MVVNTLKISFWADHSWREGACSREGRSNEEESRKGGRTGKNTINRKRRKKKILYILYLFKFICASGVFTFAVLKQKPIFTV